MRLVSALAIAFSTYSRIPMPHVDWSDDNRRHAMCFFPLIGVAIGALLIGWLALCDALTLPDVMAGAVAAVLPLWVSGGIHMDGFCDTMDALSSWQPVERRLEILKDTHVGAFAVIGCVAYMALQLGVFSAARAGAMAAQLALGFVLSRSLSGWAVVSLRGAKSSGLLNAFAGASDRRVVRRVMVGYLLIAGGALLALGPVPGALGLAACAASFLYYKEMAYRKFGGVTGDLAGYFLQVCELAFAFAVALGWRFV
ncbi:MAG: adenosylcobinamide-GDP ribazoletransferase [Clostridiales bacterium]|nr:adenosylcobinamide-GDP ribazoletransferase [Clostridiales bacterium]